MSLVTLTTDFGYQDYYVGAMKGAIMAINPAATIVDLCYAIPSCDIQTGADNLWHGVCEFSNGSIHVAVVDPGVGSSRRGLVLRAYGALWVGPDNGLFHFAMSDPTFEAFEIAAQQLMAESVSATFHGRDIFVPIAAHLSNGIDPRDVGPPVAEPERLKVTPPVKEENLMRGQIVAVDHFGNLITNIAAYDFEPERNLEIRSGNYVLTGLNATYSDVEPSATLALLGSSQRVELATNNGHAAEQLGLHVREPVTLHSLT